MTTLLRLSYAPPGKSWYFIVLFLFPPGKSSYFRYFPSVPPGKSWHFSLFSPVLPDKCWHFSISPLSLLANPGIVSGTSYTASFRPIPNLSSADDTLFTQLIKRRSIPNRGKIFPSTPRPDRLFGPHSLISKAHRKPFTGSKSARTWIWLLTPN